MRNSSVFSADVCKWSDAKRLFKTSAAVMIVTGFLVVACLQRAEQSTAQKQRSGSSDSQTDSNKDKENSIPSMGESSGNLPLRALTDVPLTGGATRLDYQSLDSDNGRLYIAHLGSDLMTVFDVNKQTVVGDVKDLEHRCARTSRRLPGWHCLCE